MGIYLTKGYGQFDQLQTVGWEVTTLIGIVRLNGKAGS